MARYKSIGIRKQLTSLISTRQLNRLAEQVGLIRRRRKVEPTALFWTVVLGFGVGVERSFAGLRRSFIKSTGLSLSPSSFYKRFTESLLEFFRAVVAKALGESQGLARHLGGALAPFRDVLIADSTLVKLHDLLEKKFPGCRTNSAKAAAKLHMVLSVRAAGPHSIKVTSGRQHDRPVLRAGNWVRGSLFLGDLGYFHYQLFDRIDRNGGYFISRLKENANPRIVATHRQWRGNAVAIVGEKLRDVADRLKRAVLDVEVEVMVTRRAYRGKQTREPRKFRLVGQLNEETNRYHFYLTNIPPDVLSSEEIGRVYSARWLVELLFKELKSHYHLAEMPSAKAHIVETLLLSSVLTLLVSRQLLRALRAVLASGTRRRVPEHRWAALFSGVASEILNLVLLPAKLASSLASRLERMLIAEAVDPNLSRPLLLERATNWSTC